MLQLLSSKVAAETDAISSQRHSISQAKERIDCIDKAVHAAEAMADAEERCIKASDRVQSAISRQEKERSVLEKKLKERSEVRAQISLALEHRSRRQKVRQRPLCLLILSKVAPSHMTMNRCKVSKGPRRLQRPT